MTWHVWVGLVLVVLGVIWGAIGGAAGGDSYGAAVIGNAVLSVTGFGLIAYRIFVVWVRGKKSE
jgi:cytochrome b